MSEIVSNNVPELLFLISELNISLRVLQGIE